jgi:hypothetical protein
LSREPSSRPGPPPQDSDVWLLLMLLLVGLMRPIQAFVRQESWGAEAVLGLLMAGLAARALLTGMQLRRPRAPLR